MNSNGGSNAESKYNTKDLREAIPLPGGLPLRRHQLRQRSSGRGHHLAGNLVANLFVSTDVEDTAFTYTISEVDADGTAHNIRNGLLTLAYRNDRYAQAVYDYVPRPGGGDGDRVPAHRLDRLRRQPHPHRHLLLRFPRVQQPRTNTVGNWAEQTETKIANQTIYIGGEYPSSVTLPTSPWARGPSPFGLSPDFL